VGSVMHHRLAPRRHMLRYRVFWMLIDLDEPARLSQQLRLFSHNRLNLFSFHDTDHGDGATMPLRFYVERELDNHGMAGNIGRITLLCMPRILGYVFNPLSIYFCYRKDGDLAALLYEVRNTFGQRHSYLIPVVDQAPVVRQRCRKAFYVSPFLDMDMTYDFRIARPGKRISAVVRAYDVSGTVIVASLAGQRHTLTDSALALVLLTHPLLTLKVIAAIHWEALKIWLKGIRLRPRPPAPTEATSFIAIERPEVRP
jgi:DUF1365 family protein